MSEVERQIAELRAHMNADTEADLARKLRIDQSTISTWKSRGSVPKRFLSIVEGGASHQLIDHPPLMWGEHETEAFALALFRFARLTGEVALSGDYRSAVECFPTTSPGFWFLVSDAQNDLMAAKRGANQGFHTTRLLLMHEDIEMGAAAIERDRQRLGDRWPKLRERLE